MASTYTTSLKLLLQGTGDNAGNWGSLVNTDLTALVDQAVAGYLSITMANADYTLTSGNGSASNESRNMYLNVAGTNAAARNVICPSVSKLYFVRNNTVGGFAITFKTSAGTGVTIPNGAGAVLMCNGTNVIAADTAMIGAASAGAAAGDSITLAAGGNSSTGAGGNLSLSSGANTSTGACGIVDISAPGSSAGGGSYITMSTANAERLRVDKLGNIGIGVAGPATKLDVNGTVRVRAAAQLQFFNADNTSGASIQNSGATSLDALTFSTSANERMRIDGSGNVTPGANGTQAFGSSTADWLGVYTRSVERTTTGDLTISASNASGQIAFRTAGGERARIDSAGHLRINGSAETAPVAVTYGTTTTIGCSGSNVFTMTFGAGSVTTLTLNGPSTGQTINWLLTQDGTGGRTIAWPASFKFSGGNTLSTAANAVDLLVATYIGTTWYATITKGFA